MRRIYTKGQNCSCGRKRLWGSVSMFVGAFLIGGYQPTRGYEFADKKTVQLSPISEWMDTKYENATQELERLKQVIGEPWEGSEVVKVRLDSSSVNVKGDMVDETDSLDGKRKVVFGEYKRLKIKYPRGSRKRLIAIQNCMTGMTALINHSPMRIKTELSIYLPFGSNLDPINNQGLTYLMGFIFLNMGSEVDDYALAFEDYIEKQQGKSITSVTVSSMYTKLTVSIPDVNAIEALKRFTDSVGYTLEDSTARKSFQQEGSDTFYVGNRPLTTNNLLKSLCKLYYIYKSCLRDEEYRIRFIKTSMRASRSRKSRERGTGEEEGEASGPAEHDMEEPILEYFSSCGIFSMFWQEHLTFLSFSTCSLQSNITEEVLPSNVQDWLHNIKLLVKEHYENYWLPENMYLFVDSALDYRQFEASLRSKMVVFGNECDNKGKIFIENEMKIREAERRKENNDGAASGYKFNEIVDAETERLEDSVKVFNIVPLSYNKRVLDIDYKIDLNNLVHAFSVSLTRVMDVVTALYFDSKMIRRLRDELGIIKDFRLMWKLHYSSLVLRVVFRFYLKSVEVMSAKRVVEDFYSYSIFLLRQFERRGGDGKGSQSEFEVSKELFNIVDEVQRLNEINWHIQYMFEGLPTQLTTPISSCGVPIQVSQFRDSHSNWVKNEIRVYNPLLHKNYPQLILSSIHRSHTRLPKECEAARTEDKEGCNTFRLDADNKISEASSARDTGTIIFSLLEFIIRHIVELKASVIFTDPYFRYRSDFVLKVKAYNYHEYLNMQFSSYYEKNNLFKSQDIVKFENKENWSVPEKIVHFESSFVIPIHKEYKTLTKMRKRLVFPSVSYKNELGVTMKINNLKFYSPIVFARSILRTKVSACRIFGNDFCEVSDVSKIQKGLIMLNLLSDIFNISIEDFWESEPIPGYEEMLSMNFYNSGTRYSNWRVPESLTKPFHFGFLVFGRMEIEFNFIGPSCSLISYIKYLFEQLSKRFKPLETGEFYKTLRDIMKEEIKDRRNRTPIDYILYYQGILQYEDSFEDESFINTGISITYDNYLAFHNYIMESFFSKDSIRPRQEGFMETVILGIRDDEFSKVYTETILERVYFEKSESYKKVCMLQEPYVAFSVEEEPLIVRQVFTDGILTTSSASIRFQLPCNGNSSTGLNSHLANNDVFFEDKEYNWETNDNTQPRCIFNTVVSRVLQRIFREYYSSIVKKLAMGVSQNNRNTGSFRNMKSNFDARGEVETSYYKLNSIPQFTLYILSSHFDSFTLLSILRDSIEMFKTEIIDSEEKFSQEKFNSIKSYFIKYYCSEEKIQIRNIRYSLLEMSKWRYNYNWKYESCNIIRTLKKRHVIQFYKDYFLPDSPYRRSFVLLLQAPPFDRLLSNYMHKDTLNNPQVSTSLQKYIVSLLGRRRRIDYCTRSNAVKDEDWTISMLSYPCILQTDFGILNYKFKSTRRYQPRCSKVILEAANSEKQQN